MKMGAMGHNARTSSQKNCIVETPPSCNVEEALSLMKDREEASAALNALLQKEMSDRKLATSYYDFRARCLRVLGKLGPPEYADDLAEETSKEQLTVIRKEAKAKKKRYDKLKEAWLLYDSLAIDKPDVLTAEDKAIEREMDEIEEDINQDWQEFVDDIIEQAELDNLNDWDVSRIKEWQLEQVRLTKDLEIIKERKAQRDNMRRRAEMRRVEEIVRARRSEEFKVDVEEALSVDDDHNNNNNNSIDDDSLDGASLDGTAKTKSSSRKHRKKSKDKKKKSKKKGLSTKSRLLEEVFPPHIAKALREGRKVEPESKEIVTVFFSDIVGFTNISSSITPLKVSQLLDRLYQKFDKLSHEHDVYKVETIGDSWMGVTNLVKDQTDHAERVAFFAMDALKAAQDTWVDEEDKSLGKLNLRVGFHSGPVVANVVGTRNPRYCLFGDTVNTASRMESNSMAGRIHCSGTSAALLEKAGVELVLHSRGELEIKGKGPMETFFVGGEPVEIVPKAPKSNASASRSQKSFFGWRKSSDSADPTSVASPLLSKNISEAATGKSIEEALYRVESPKATSKRLFGLFGRRATNRRGSLDAATSAPVTLKAKSRRASLDTISSESTPERANPSKLRPTERIPSLSKTPKKDAKPPTEAPKTPPRPSPKKETQTKENPNAHAKVLLDPTAHEPCRPMTAESASSGKINQLLASSIKALEDSAKVRPEEVTKKLNEVYENVKISQENREQFGSGKGIKILVDIMARFENDPSILEIAFRLMAVLAQSEANRSSLALYGSIPKVIKGLKTFQKDTLLQQSGCEALANMAGTPRHQDEIVASHGIETIMASQKANVLEGSVQVSCFRALRCLAKDKVVNASSIAAAGGTRALMEILQSKTFPLVTVIDLHVEAFRAMAELARQNESNRGSIAAAGGIPKLLGGMSCFSRSTDLVEAGCDALYCLSIDHSQNCDTIVAYDGIRIVLEFMKKRLGHAGLQEKGLMLIYSLMENSNTAQFRTPENCAETVKQVLEKHPDHKIVQKIGHDLVSLLEG